MLQQWVGNVKIIIEWCETLGVDFGFRTSSLSSARVVISLWYHNDASGHATAWDGVIGIHTTTSYPSGEANLLMDCGPIKPHNGWVVVATFAGFSSGPTP